MSTGRWFLVAALAIAAAVPSGAQALAPVGGEVVGLWQGEGDATDPFHGHDGTLLAGAGFTPSSGGQAFSFSGAAEEGVDIPDAPDLYSPGSFTIAGWVRTTQATGHQALMAHYECGLFCPTGNAESLFALEVSAGNALAEIRDADTGPPGEEEQLLTGPAVADGRFHHLAFVRDSAAAQVRLYVDGTLAVSEPVNKGAEGPLENLDGEADDLYLGSFRRCGGGGECDGTLVDRLDGALDDAIYWNRAVTAPELAAIAAAGPNGLTTDASAPSSAASAPASAPAGPIAVAFTAADGPGPAPRVHDPSGLARVDLYAKAPGESAFAKVASAPGAAAGTFSYAPTHGPGTYSFETSAADQAGNAEPLPAAPDASTTLAAPVATEPAKPSPVTIARLFSGLPSTKACVSKRDFKIHLVVPQGVKVLSATVLLNGRRIAVRKGKRLSAPIDLRGLPKGRYAVKVVVRLAGGKTISETRRYRTCAAGHHGHR